ncbi:lysin A, protease M23 domain [Gordonia phage ASerpRocky]|uniref:Lysin A, protease M23 domain n=1 Tax=Gordonia phage ASerpRocky TaxID=2599841 RepID=A0A5J6TC78_9CAUD|nr:lysin A, protease M23 domain [Gordonia phage ASerpRocky]
MVTRYHPMKKGYIITSPFGWRDFDKAVHQGIDFGHPDGSGGMPVFAVQAGTVIMAGTAQGYGGPDPHGWLVIDSDDSQGSGVFEYGHITRLPSITVGTKVKAGQRIATINPNRSTNGGTAPHVHISYMPYEYNPNKKQNWSGLLKNAYHPGEAPPPPIKASAPTPPKETPVAAADDVKLQLRGPKDNGWPQLAAQPDDDGVRFSPAHNGHRDALSLVDGLAVVIKEVTLRLPRATRGVRDYLSRKGDTVAGNAANAAAIAYENNVMLKALCRKEGIAPESLTDLER